MKNEYHDIACPSADEMIAALDRNDPKELLLAIVGIALYHKDAVFAEEACIKLAQHNHFNIRGNAVLGLGHLARRFGSLNEPVVRPIIESALNDSSDYVRGQARTAAEDVAQFLGWRVTGFDGEQESGQEPFS